ncbi:MAG: LamG-like jellyroll fold domain-containing protein [Candidatus Paceibacterota bacterium]
MIVIAIIGILAGMVVVNMSGATDSARVAKSKAFSSSLRSSLLMNRVSEWNFDEVSGTSALDAWGSNPGTLVNGPVRKSGSDCVSGGCLQFDGTDDYVISNVSISSSDSYSIELWFKSFGNTSGKHIFEGNILSSPSLEGTDSTYRFYIGNTAPVEIGAISVGRWYHFFGTFDKPTGTRKAYFDGRLMGTNISTVSDNMAIFYLASRGGSTRFFNGSIDETRIYNAALPAAAVRENYFAGLEKLLAGGRINEEEYQQRSSELNLSYAAK